MSRSFVMAAHGSIRRRSVHKSADLKRTALGVCVDSRESNDRIGLRTGAADSALDYRISTAEPLDVIFRSALTSRQRLIPPAEPSYSSAMRHRTYLYLGGDSYPLDRHIEDALRERLAGKRADFYGEAEIVGAPIHQGFARRAHLDSFIARSRQAPADLVLIGRSSGARIVTMSATARRSQGIPAAVVAIGYPFKHPERVEEPERYAHLPLLTTPTLIVQGERDPYGGHEVATRFSRQPVVQVAMVDGDHELHLSCTEWDRIAHMIQSLQQI